MKIKLETAGGEFVHEQEIPPFNEPPEVIGWGNRVFKLHGTEKRPNGYTIYRECFAYALPSPGPVPATEPFSAEAIKQDPILQFFAYAHLPAKLQVYSSMFADVAYKIMALIPRSAERTVSLRKLLEAKDAGVRAALMAPKE